MKKIVGLLMVIMLLMSLAACANSDPKEAQSAEVSDTSATDATAESKSSDADTKTTEKTEDTSAAVAGIALDGSWPSETVKIAFECFDTTDEQFLAIQTYYAYLAQYFNIEIMYSESIASAEDELKFIENAAAAGCKAVIGYYNVAEGQAVQLAIDKGMYYWGGADKASIYDKFVDNDMYLGGYDGGDANYMAGYAMGKALIDAGCEKLVYTSGGRDFGIDFFIDRSAGFYAAVDEAKKTNPNVEVVYDVSGWPGTDSFVADQTKVCDMDIDGIGNSFSALVWIQPLQSVGKFETVKMSTLGNTNEAYQGLMGAGSIIAIVYENEEVQFGGAIPMILNAVNGDNAVNRNNNKAANYQVSAWLIQNPAEINAIVDKHGAGEYYVSAEEVASMIKTFNPEATYQTLSGLYAAKTMDIILK